MRMAIAKTLQDHREKKGFSKTFVADQTGKTISTISQIESEGRGLTIEALVDICGVLDVKVEAIIKRAGKDG